MRKLFLIAMCAALAACGQSTEQPAPKPSGTISAPMSAPMIPTLASFAGTYEYTLPDGTGGITTMLPDGTFTDVMADEAVKGSWSVTDDKVCIDPEGDGADEARACYTISQPDADGVQTATADSGTVTRIKRQGAA